MVKTAYILAGAFIYCLLGCHNTNLAPPNAGMPLTDIQLNLVRNINSAIGTTLSAARQAYPTVALTADTDTAESKPQDTPSDKMQKMITLLKAGQCSAANVPPAEKVDQSWQGSWTISGSGCPIELNELSQYNSTLHQWKYARTIGVKSKDFRDVSGLGGVTVQGSLEKGPVLGGKHTVAGSLKYGGFTVDGVLPVAVTIDVRPLGADDGQIVMKLNTGDIDVQVLVLWGPSKHAITLNGREIDELTYNDLFSSFQLLELLDRVQKMM